MASRSSRPERGPAGGCKSLCCPPNIDTRYTRRQRVTITSSCTRPSCSSGPAAPSCPRRVPGRPRSTCAPGDAAPRRAAAAPRTRGRLRSDASGTRLRRTPVCTRCHARRRESAAVPSGSQKLVGHGSLPAPSRAPERTHDELARRRYACAAYLEHRGRGRRAGAARPGAALTLGARRTLQSNLFEKVSFSRHPAAMHLGLRFTRS